MLLSKLRKISPKVMVLISIILLSCQQYAQEHKEYFKSGQLKESGQFDKNGKQTGVWKYYYSDGKLEQIKRYQNGIQIGKQETYYENGELMKSRVIELDPNGDTIGEYKYYSDGQLYEHGYYKNGSKSGTWKYYNEHKRLKETGAFKNGKRIDVWKTFHGNGELRSIERYKNGLRSGLATFYHNDTITQSIGQYEKGTQVGEWKFYDNRDGKLTRIGKYDENKGTKGWEFKEVIEWEYYNENEELIRIEKYNPETKEFETFDKKGNRM